MSISDAKTNIIKCNKCKTGYYTSESVDIINPASLCVSYHKIENCEVYDNQSLYSKNTAKCTKCVDGFYVSEYGLNCL